MITVANAASGAQAQETLVYSFETGLEGFVANGTGITVSQDTIGATVGDHSMKVAMTGPTFVGARGDMLHPAIGDPPGLDHVLFDLTLTEAFPEGGFAVVGVMVFGVDQTGADAQLQTGRGTENPELEFHIDGLEPGTYPVKMDMTQFVHPVTFDDPATFNDIVGTEGSGPNDMIPTSFQLYFNKSGGLGFPLTVYIDNIRVGTTVENIPGDFNGNGTVELGDFNLVVANWGNEVPPNPEPWTGDPPTAPQVDLDDFNKVVANWGNSNESAANGSVVPEPTSCLLLLTVFVCASGQLRRRTNSKA